MTKLGVVSNVQSQQNKRGMDAIYSALDDAPEVRHARLTGIDGLSQTLEEFAREGVGGPCFCRERTRARCLNR